MRQGAGVGVGWVVCPSRGLPFLIYRCVLHSFVLICHAETRVLFEEENLERRELSL